MDILKVTDDDTVADIEEAISHLRASQKRDSRAKSERYHERINALLDEWEWRMTGKIPGS